MRIAVIKGDCGRRDRIHVTRPDGTEARWTAPGGPGMPHDLMHHVVESVLGLRSGFWGLVAAGVDFVALKDGAPELAGRDTTELMQSEAVAGALMQSLLVPELVDDDIARYVGEQCDRAGIPAPDLGRERLGALRGGLKERVAEWESLAAGEALVLDAPA